MLGCAIKSPVKSTQRLIEEYPGNRTPHVHTRLPQESWSGSARGTLFSQDRTPYIWAKLPQSSIPKSGSPRLLSPDTLCLVKTSLRPSS